MPVTVPGGADIAPSAGRPDALAGTGGARPAVGKGNGVNHDDAVVGATV
ncbi:hypothetical protein [Streptomyces sp. ITFR-6]|nr:hypothetical protein [Streptomyces sp. ITFR-6]WNI31839.1 hypothetical protein RLT59_25925 [Streptomyces sp. ITFR-6]